MTAIQPGTDSAVVGDAAPVILTPLEYLALSAITVEIKRLGATDEHLEMVQWRGATHGLPFDQWSVKGHPGMPVAAVRLLKPYCTMKWLILEEPPPSRERDDAWHYISLVLGAPIFEIGLRAMEAQQARARKPRGKTEDGSTIGEIIDKLAHAPIHRDLTAKELWPHFFADLEERGLAPQETKAPRDRLGAAYTYEAQVRRKQITFSRFATIVSQFRRQKNPVSPAGDHLAATKAPARRPLPDDRQETRHGARLASKALDRATTSRRPEARSA
jgi:hypothetical protein